MLMTERRSKLQRYVDTLEALSSGPTNLSRLTLKTKINCCPLKAILSDLLRKKLVEERKIKTSILYAVTPKARIVISKLNELNRLIPVN